MSFRSLIFLGAFFLLAGAPGAYAVVTITAGDSRPVISPDNGTTNYIYQAVITPTKTHLADNNSGVPYGVVDTADKFKPIIDVRYVPGAAEFGTTSKSYTPYMYFNVTSSTAKAPGGAGELLLTVKAGTETGAQRIPISMVGEADCNGTLCQGGVDRDINGTNYKLYYAIHYTPGDTVTVALSPYFACLVASAATGCSSTGLVSPDLYPAGSSTEMPLLFEFVSAPDTTGALTNLTVQDSAKVTVRFQVDHPTFGCPDATGNPQAVFYPGDGSVSFDFPQFYITVSGSTTQPSSVSRAPLNAIIVVAKQGANANVDLTNLNFLASGANDIVKRSTTRGGWELVDGFENSTPSAMKKYSVSFLARDAAGLLAAPGAVGSGTQCALSQVVTADVQGLLARGNCFVATAAFRDSEAAPVSMLRAFRSQVLMKSHLGRLFVRNYYRYSYGPASWLLENPVYRGPVLLALVPLQMAALAALHPGLAAVVIFAAAGLIGMLLWRRKQSEVRG